MNLTPCIEFEGAKNPKGYGRKWFDGETIGAHRAAYCKANGLSRASIKGTVILHTCDNPSCVNPDHLVLGTNLENLRDRDEKGRQAKGERHGCAKLCADEVKFIRLWIRRGHSLVSIARAFGVSATQVGYVKRGRLWKCLGEQ